MVFNVSVGLTENRNNILIHSSFSILGSASPICRLFDFIFISFVQCKDLHYISISF